MIETPDFEKLFFLYTRNNPKYLKNINENFYESNELKTLHSITQKFNERFSQIPSKDQLKLISKQDKFKDLISDSLIDIIFEESLESYDPEWIQETCQSWILWKSLDKSLIDTIEYVKTVKVTPDNVKDIINKVKSLINDRNNITFNQNLGKNFFDADSHIPEANSKITTCHNFVDQYSGGYRTKSLIIYAGEMNIGKCLHKNTLITIKNKKTGLIQKIRIEDFYNLIKTK